MPYTQAERLIKLDTPLGDDVLLLKSLSGQESLSQPFKFELELMTERGPIEFKDIIGKKVNIRITLGDGNERVWNGVVNKFAQTGSETGLIHFRAEVVPWLWFLTRRANCRVFPPEQMTVLDIIKKVFEDVGYLEGTDFKFDQALVDSGFEPREFCVQYRETDFNFVSRLMEQYGIFYFFQHKEGEHVMVIANDPLIHQPCPGQGDAHWESMSNVLEAEDVITSLELEQEVHPGKFTLTDYNYTDASTSLLSETTSTVDVAENDKYEIYDYPGEYVNKTEGEKVVTIRMEEEEAQHLMLSGTSTCKAFSAGYRFNLTGYQPEHINQAYLLTMVQHTASIEGDYSSTAAEEYYSNSFMCIPHAFPFRPPQVTPKPVIQGPQTAIVVGKQEEEIWTDEFGRIKVQFHWDREGQQNENSSCWIRVAQSWAGKGWGAVFLPRVGHEVMVEFLEGDPDRPIVTGSVYNNENMPPYELPAEQTKSTIKTLSSKDGDGFNEIRFEDKKGEEQLFFHAEKDMDVRVKNDVREFVGNNTHLHVTKDQIEEIDNDRHETIKRDHNIEIVRDQNLKITGKQAIEIGDSHSLTVTGDVIEVFKAAHSEETTGDIYLKGDNIIIEAMTNITLKVGGSYIAIEAGGITIEGAGPVEVKSPNTTVSGDGMLTLEGGLVKIN